jgi:hypothetical protein
LVHDTRRSAASDDRKPAPKIKRDPQHQDNSPRLPKESKRRASTYPESKPVTKRAKKQHPPCQKNYESQLIAVDCSNDILRSERDMAKEGVSPSIATLRQEMEDMTAAHKAVLQQKETELEEWKANLVAAKETIEVLQQDQSARVDEIFELDEMATAVLTNTALPDVVTSLPLTDIDVDDDANESADSLSDTRSNNHPRVTEPSTSAQGIKVEPVFNTDTAPAPVNPSTSTHAIKLEAVVKTETAPANPSTSTHAIKLEPVVKTETAPAANTSTDRAEASLTTEPMINSLNLNRAVTVHRKAAKRTDPLFIAPPPPPQNIAVPFSPSPQAEEFPARKKPRIEEPLPPTSTDEAGRKIAAPDISVGLPTPATPPSTDAMDTWTRRRSRRQIELPPIETSEAQLDNDADFVDGGDDLAGPVSPPFATVNTSTRRRSSRSVIPTSSAGTPILPPCTAAVNALTNTSTSRRSSRSVIPTSSTGTPILPPCTAPVNTLTRRRSSSRVIPTSSTGTPVPPPTATVDTPTLRQCRSRRQTQLPSIETSVVQRDDDGGDSSGPVWEVRLSELADYRKIHGHCSVPTLYSENAKLAKWVSNQRQKYKLHEEGKTSTMTIFRIQALKAWVSNGTVTTPTGRSV